MRLSFGSICGIILRFNFITVAQNPDQKLSKGPENLHETTSEKLAAVAVDGRLERVENLAAANARLDARLAEAKAKWFPQNWYCLDILGRCAESCKKEMAAQPELMSAVFETSMDLIERLDTAMAWLKGNKTKETGRKILEGLGMNRQEVDRVLDHVEPDKFIQAVAVASGGYDVERMAALSLYSFFQNETPNTTTANQRAFNSLYLKPARPAVLLQILETLPSRQS